MTNTETIRTEAVAWVARLHGRTLTAAERAKFDEWLDRDPNHSVAYDSALQAWRDSAQVRGSEQSNDALQKLTWRERTVGVLGLPRWLVATVAVAIAVVVWFAMSRTG